MKPAVALPDTDENAPSFCDTRGRVWRLVTPTEVGEGLRKYATSRYRTCPHLCHWVADDHERAERYVLTGLPCQHQKPKLSKLHTVDLDGTWAPAEPDWTVSLTARTISMLGVGTGGAVSVVVSAEEWVRLLGTFGYDTEGLLMPEGEAGEKLRLGYRLFDHFILKDQHRTHTNQLTRPNNSTKWRERQRQILDERAAFEAEGWAPAAIDQAEELFSRLINQRNHFTGELWYSSLGRTEAAWRIGSRVFETGGQETERTAADEQLGELLGW